MHVKRARARDTLADAMTSSRHGTYLQCSSIHVHVLLYQNNQPRNCSTSGKEARYFFKISIFGSSSLTVSRIVDSSRTSSLMSLSASLASMMIEVNTSAMLRTTRTGQRTTMMMRMTATTMTTKKKLTKVTTMMKMAPAMMNVSAGNAPEDKTELDCTTAYDSQPRSKRQRTE